jgi:hypothetical protein
MIVLKGLWLNGTCHRYKGLTNKKKSKNIRYYTVCSVNYLTLVLRLANYQLNIFIIFWLL